MPSIVAQAAKRQGAEVWGFTPARDASEQQQSYPTDDIHIYDRLFFIPPEYNKKFFLEEPFVDARDRSTNLKCRFFVLRKNEVIESVLLR
jgi:hypothetical protein